MPLVRIVSPQKLKKGVNVRIEFRSKVTFNVTIAAGLKQPLKLKAVFGLNHTEFLSLCDFVSFPERNARLFD